jgi:hypothetical protein
MKNAVVKGVLSAIMVMAVSGAQGRPPLPALRSSCAPAYCTRQAQTCLQACATTTTNAANRDHTLALCQNFCRDEDMTCRADLCRASRRRHP